MRLRWTSMVIPVAIVAMVAASTPATAAPDDKTPVVSDSDQEWFEPAPGRFRSWLEFYDAQQRIDTVGMQILVAAQGTSGYGGIIVSAVNNRLDLYWKGTLPESVRLVVGRAEVPVVLHEAAYAEADLIALAARVSQLDGVTQAGPKPDGSGLIVKVSRNVPSATMSELRATVNIPFSLSYKETSNFGAFSKTDDMAPYWGGARIVWKPSGAMCSSGFAIRLLATGERKMLTAGHCLPWGSTFDVFTDGGGQEMGTASHQEHFRDTVMIDTTVAPRIYTGNFNSSTSRPVRGSLPDFVGDFVCRSSAFSNQVCNLEVEDVNQSAKGSGPGGSWSVFPLVEVDHLSGQPAEGNGDSGGSVFTFTQDGGVMARGTVSMDDHKTVPCTGVPSGPQRKCTTGMFYADVFWAELLYFAKVISI